MAGLGNAGREPAPNRPANEVQQDAGPSNVGFRLNDRVNGMQYCVQPLTQPRSVPFCIAQPAAGLCFFSRRAFGDVFFFFAGRRLTAYATAHFFWKRLSVLSGFNGPFLACDLPNVFFMGPLRPYYGQ